MLSRARSLLKKAQDRQKAYADKKRAQVPQGISVGKKVLLSTENLRLLIVGSQKFMPRYIGPFLVKEEIHRAAFRLVTGDLASRPHTMRCCTWSMTRYGPEWNTWEPESNLTAKGM